jgi:hypothetical protein
LHYPRCPGAEHFIGYSDSDLAGDIDTSKSTSGTLFFLGGSSFRSFAPELGWFKFLRRCRTRLRGRMKT